MLLNHISNRYVVGIVPSIAPSVGPSGASPQDNFHALKLKLTAGAMKRYPEPSLVTSKGYYLRIEDQDQQPAATDNAAENPPIKHD